MKLKLLEFISNNKDWEELLSIKPYFIKITRYDNFIIFKYNQIESDFNLEIVRECRGIILDSKFIPVCVPFFKFGNLGESYCPKLDFSKCRVQEKIDGSIIKVWNYKGQWKISTNGTIDAVNATLSCNIDNSILNFYNLFNVARFNQSLILDSLNKQYTYMFELVGPYNRCVIPYQENKIYHIGTRDNITLEELNIDIGIQKPKEYSFDSIEDCVEMTKTMTFMEEGYVVVDEKFNRVKIKSPAYVAAHHLYNNGVVTKERILELIRINEEVEFLIYYPEYTTHFNKIKEDIDKFIAYYDNIYYDLQNNFFFGSKKEFANYIIKSYKCTAILFALYDKKYKNTKEWLNAQSNEKIINYIGEI